MAPPPRRRVGPLESACVLAVIVFIGLLIGSYLLALARPHSNAPGAHAAIFRRSALTSAEWSFAYGVLTFFYFTWRERQKG